MRIGYDAKGRVISLTDPLNQVRQFSYDSRDNVIQMTDANGNVTRREYDTNGRLVAQINALNQMTRYVYDTDDHLVQVIDPRGNSTHFNYDAKGQLIEVIDELKRSRQIIYDETGNVIAQADSLGKPIAKFSYDENNNLTQSENALGHQTQLHYDDLNRVVESVNPLGDRTQFSYDGLNRLVSSVDALNGVSSQGFDAEGQTISLTDPNQNQTQFEYDRSGRLVAETVATGHPVRYQYNARDLLTQVTNGRGQQRQLEYDALGRLTRLSDVDGTITYSYDANGNVLTVTDAQGTITRTYDALNRIKTYTDINSHTLAYEYDAVGNLIRLTYPDGKQVRYAYDKTNALVHVIDWANRVTQYGYDENGRLFLIQRSNGTQQIRWYDSQGQLTELKDTDAQGRVIVSYTFRYDAAGNIIEEVKQPTTTIPQVNLDMEYGLANQITHIQQTPTQFDNDGNLLQAVLDGNTMAFSFNSRNHLMQAGETSYRYDAENQRIAVNDTQYVVNSQPHLSQVLVRTKGNGEVTYYVYGLGLIGEESAGNYFNYHYDFRGSTVALTNTNGQVIERVDYSPFGELLTQPTHDTPFLFNGMYGVMTDANDLYYMRARFYSPDIRRFVNQDILLGGIADGQSLNRFAYVRGRVISRIDPFGLEDVSGDYSQEFNNSEFENGEGIVLTGDQTIEMILLAIEAFNTGSDIAAICTAIPTNGGSLIANFQKKKLVEAIELALKNYSKKKRVSGKDIDANDLNISGSTQPELYQDTLDGVMEQLKSNPDEFWQKALENDGPITIWEINGKRYLYNGNHRFFAAQKAGVKIPKDSIIIVNKNGSDIPTFQCCNMDIID